MKKIDEIKVDLVNSKWLSFNKINLQEDPLIQVLSKTLKKDETVYSIVDGIILIEDKKLAKESEKLAKLQEKQAKSDKPLTEEMQKTMDEVANELANPKRAGKAIMVMTDKRVITVYENLNKDYKIKAYKRNIEDIMGIDASKDANSSNLFNFVVSFGKVVIRMVTTSEQNIKHFEFALDQTIAMQAENEIIKQDEKIVEKEAKKIVKADKAETKKAPAKKAAKPVAKKAPAKKPAAKKPAAKKSSKPAAKKPAAKKPAAKKTTKPAAKKPVAKKAPAKKATKPVAKKSAPKAAPKKVDAVVIGDENKSFKKQEKEISKVEKKQAKETKKDAKKAFKPAKAKKAKPAKKQKPAKATKAKKEKAAKPAKAKKASKFSFKSIFDLTNIWQIVIAVLTMGIVACGAIIISGDWTNRLWVVPAACEVGFSAIAIILLVITMIPEILKNKFSYAKGMGLVLFVFILVLAIVATAQVSYSIMDGFQFIVIAMSAWLIFDNLFNGIKGLIKPAKRA